MNLINQDWPEMITPRTVNTAPAKVSKGIMREAELNAIRLRGEMTPAEHREWQTLVTAPVPADVQAELKGEGRLVRPFRTNLHGE